MHIKSIRRRMFMKFKRVSVASLILMLTTLSLLTGCASLFLAKGWPEYKKDVSGLPLDAPVINSTPDMPSPDHRLPASGKKITACYRACPSRITRQSLQVWIFHVELRPSTAWFRKVIAWETTSGNREWAPLCAQSPIFNPAGSRGTVDQR